MRGRAEEAAEELEAIAAIYAQELLATEHCAALPRRPGRSGARAGPPRHAAVVSLRSARAGGRLVVLHARKMAMLL